MLGKDWLGRKLYARKRVIDKAILYKEIKNLQPDDIIDYFKMLSEEKIESLRSISGDVLMLFLTSEKFKLLEEILYCIYPIDPLNSRLLITSKREIEQYCKFVFQLYLTKRNGYIEGSVFVDMADVYKKIESYKYSYAQQTEFVGHFYTEEVLNKSVYQLIECTFGKKLERSTVDDMLKVSFRFGASAFVLYLNNEHKDLFDQRLRRNKKELKAQLNILKQVKPKKYLHFMGFLGQILGHTQRF